MLIAFATLGLRFDGDSINRMGIGGSETACICLARALKQRGHEVHVFCLTDHPGIYDGVTYHPIADLYRFNAVTQFDVFVCSRHFELLRKEIRAKLILAWCHDVLVNKEHLQAALWQVDKVILLSKFHVDNHLAQVPDLSPLVWQSSNGVDMDVVRANIRPKVPGKLIYTSRPERGLIYLLRDIFPQLLKDRPDLTLHVCAYDTPGLQIPDEVAQIHAECTRLIGGLGDRVVRLGSLTKARLYQEISSAELWVYPTDFPEISCIGAMEAQACGTWYVTTNAFALPEAVHRGAPVQIGEDEFAIAPAGDLIAGTPGEESYLDRFSRNCIYALAIGQEPAIVAADQKYGPAWIEHAGFTWPAVAARWEAMMVDEIASRPHRVKNLVVFASRSLWFNGNSLEEKGIGGSETSVIYLSRELAKRGHEVHVFCLCDKPGIYDGVAYHEIDDIVAFNAAHIFDVFVSAQFTEILIDFPIRARMKVYWAQGMIWQMGGKEAVDKMLRQTDRLVMVSEFQADSYRAEIPGIDSTIAVLHNAVDMPTVSANIRSKALNKLIYSSKRERGLLYLLRDIFPALLRTHPNLFLYLATYECPGFVLPPEVHEIYVECDRLIEALGDRVVQLGALTKARLYQEISSAQVMVYPCKFEEAGCITVTEAQACGTPVVTTDAYCMREMANSGLGCLIPGLPGEPEYTAQFVARTREFLDGDGTTNAETSLQWMASEGRNWPMLAEKWEGMISGCLGSSKPTVAACLIVKNEEADLYRCLSHIAPFVDELHIIDTGSTDRTLEIARRFNPTTLRSILFDNFAQARNESIRDVKADWILWIDADEVLVGGEHLRAFLNTRYFNGYVVRQRHVIFDAPPTEDAPIRLFRNRPEYRFVGYVHEHCEDTEKGPDQQIFPAMVLPETYIMHYGYSHEHIRREKASNRNMALLRRSLIEEPGRALTKVMVIRDYLNIAKWHFEEAKTITPGSDQHSALCQAVEMFLANFADEKHRYHQMAYPFYQEALAMLNTFGLPANGRAHPPFEVAFGMTGSAACGGVPQKTKLEGRSRWYPDAESYRSFISGRVAQLLAIIGFKASPVVEHKPTSPEALLQLGVNVIPDRYAKTGRDKLAG